MIDTLNMIVERYDVGRDFDPYSVADYIEVTEYADNKKTGRIIRGTLNNYKVAINESGCIYLNGSITKYRNGENSGDALTRETTIEAVQMMSDALHFDVAAAAKVVRVDVAANIPTLQPPAAYFQYLGNKSRYKRILQAETTLLYKTAHRQLQFYDKGAQNPIAQQAILLRYELRLIGQIRRQLHIAEATPTTLLQPEIYAKLIQMWGDEYRSITKINRNNKDMEEITTFGKWKETYIANLIREAGSERGESALTAAPNLDKKERYKARKWLTEQLTQDNDTSSPIEAITHAINAVVNDERNNCRAGQ